MRDNHDARPVAAYTPLIGALLLLGSLTDSGTAHSQERISAIIIADSAQIVGNGTTGPYWLSGYFLIAGTDQVLRNGAVLDLEDYTIDANNGRIRFPVALENHDTVLVRFQRLAWAIPGEWRLGNEPTRTHMAPAVHPVAYRESVTLAPATPSAPGRPTDPGASLRWQGYKSFSVTTSSQRNADWSQGLELSIDGELTPGLTLEAALSDRFSDAQIAGVRNDGTRLGDLERFFIEARSERFSGRLGEFDLPNARGLLSRQATGARATWRGNAGTVDGYAGRPSGQNVRRSITIQPRISGPYNLIAQSPSTAHPVPGTIALWLDGRRLTEGPDHDYTYDPTAGAVTLNPAVTPNARATLVAEYEQTLDDYRRTLSGAQWSLATKTIQNQVGFRWEADDPNRPLFGQLTPEQRELLRQTPEGQVRTNSADYRGPRRGDYRLEHRDGDSVFVYAGPDNGEWRVTFEIVGSGEGRYRHLAAGVYEYAGPGRGTHEPVATLGAPRSALTVRESASLTPPGAGTLHARILAHIEDPNRLAPSGARARADHHLTWSTSADLQSLQRQDALRIDWRRIGAPQVMRDASLDDLSRFSSDWGLRAAWFDSTREEFAADAITRADRRISAQLAGGYTEIGDGSAARIRSRFHAQPHTSLGLTTAINRVDARKSGHPVTGEKQDLLATSDLDLGPVMATVGWSQRTQEENGRVFEPRASSNISHWLALARDGVIAEYRWDRTRDSVFLPLRRTRALTVTVPLKTLHAGEGVLAATRGEESYADGPYNPFYSGQMSARLNPAPSLSGAADLLLSHTRGGRQREVFLPTRPGEGQYRLERGEYIPDIHGDYRRVIATDELQTVTAYDGRQRLTLSWRPTIAGWRWDAETRTERIARHDPMRFRPLVWLAPWTSHTWAPASGARAERFAFHRLSARPDQSLELTIDHDLTRSGEPGQNVGDRRDRTGLSARQRLARNWNVEGRTEWESRHRRSTTAASVDAQARTWRLTFSGTPMRGLSASLEGRRRADSDQTSGARLRLLGLRPKCQWSRGKLGITMDTDAVWVRNLSQTARSSALLAEGRPNGFSIVETLEARWQLPGQVTLRSRLFADLREQGADRWRWELETIARF